MPGNSRLDLDIGRANQIALHYWIHLTSMLGSKIGYP